MVIRAKSTPEVAKSAEAAPEAAPNAEPVPEVKASFSNSSWMDSLHKLHEANTTHKTTKEVSSDEASEDGDVEVPESEEIKQAREKKGELDSMIVPALKGLCKDNDLPFLGTKLELAGRLHDFYGKILAKHEAEAAARKEEAKRLKEEIRKQRKLAKERRMLEREANLKAALEAEKREEERRIEMEAFMKAEAEAKAKEDAAKAEAKAKFDAAKAKEEAARLEIEAKEREKAEAKIKQDEEDAKDGPASADDPADYKKVVARVARLWTEHIQKDDDLKNADRLTMSSAYRKWVRTAKLNLPEGFDVSFTEIWIVLNRKPKAKESEGDKKSSKAKSSDGKSSKDKRDDGKPAKAEQPKTVDIIFDPKAKLGLACDDDTGKVIEVDSGSQAQELGVVSGWTAIAVNDHDFSTEAMVLCIKQGKQFVVRFKKTESAEKKNDRDKQAKVEEIKIGDLVTIVKKDQYCGQKGKVTKDDGSDMPYKVEFTDGKLNGEFSWYTKNDLKSQATKKSELERELDRRAAARKAANDRKDKGGLGPPRPRDNRPRAARRSRSRSRGRGGRGKQDRGRGYERERERPKQTTRRDADRDRRAGGDRQERSRREGRRGDERPAKTDRKRTREESSDRACSDEYEEEEEEFYSEASPSPQSRRGRR